MASHYGFLEGAYFRRSPAAKKIEQRKEHHRMKTISILCPPLHCSLSLQLSSSILLKAGDHPTNGAPRSNFATPSGPRSSSPTLRHYNRREPACSQWKNPLPESQPSCSAPEQLGGRRHPLESLRVPGRSSLIRPATHHCGSVQERYGEDRWVLRGPEDCYLPPHRSYQAYNLRSCPVRGIRIHEVGPPRMEG
ncbi:hypothetical protein SAY87_011183 [Trapa incisa]|uniref:Uncharacterized protein n=1 Tax=Trapa incisa TaxID=236973 RepID=A0AAN7GIX5_9MYRT|nr:hypothetical protein SAY87_011183 [Trapa incisa]